MRCFESNQSAPTGSCYHRPRAAMGKGLTVGKRGRGKPREKRDAARNSEPAGKVEPRRAAEETTPPLRPQRGRPARSWSDGSAGAGLAARRD